MVGTKEVFALKLATTKYQSSSTYGCNFLVSTIYIINLQTALFNQEYPPKKILINQLDLQSSIPTAAAA